MPGSKPYWWLNFPRWLISAKVAILILNRELISESGYQMARLGFFFLSPIPRRVSNPHQSVELHQTETFKGRSTDWATGPRRNQVRITSIIISIIYIQNKASNLQASFSTGAAFFIKSTSGSLTNEHSSNASINWSWHWCQHNADRGLKSFVCWSRDRVSSSSLDRKRTLGKQLSAFKKRFIYIFFCWLRVEVSRSHVLQFS